MSVNNVTLPDVDANDYMVNEERINVERTPEPVKQKVTHKTKEEHETDSKLLQEELSIVKNAIFNVECNRAPLIDGELDFQSARVTEKEMLRRARLRIEKVLADI